MMVIHVALCFALLQTNAQQNLPLLAGVGELKLRVVKTEAIPRITGNMGNVLTPASGRKLVVVTLEGRVPRPCRLALEAREFGALYEVVTQAMPPAPGKREVRITLSSTVS